MIGVTGGTGFVGRRLVALLAQDAPVRVLARGAGYSPLADAESIAGDVTSREDVDRLVRGCKSIVHLAGIAHAGLRTRAEKKRAYQVNVEGTRAVLQAALRHGVERFVFVSTAHVYRAQSGLDIAEDAPIAANSFYAQTKIEAEELVGQAGGSQLQAVIVRPCLIYGPGASLNLERMMRAIDGGYYFHIAGANPFRSFLSVENAARALRYLAVSGTGCGTYNLADRHPRSLIEFANELADRMKRPRPRVVSSFAAHSAAAIGSAMQRLGIHLPISRDSLAKLTSDFSLGTRRLELAGFEWDEQVGPVLQETIDHYLRRR